MAFYDEVHTEQKRRLGTEQKDVAGNLYIYLKGVSSLTADEAVSFDEVHVTARLLNTALGRIAVSKAAVDSSSKFGWFQITGKAACKVLSSFADNSNIYATSTAGSVDDSGAGAEEFVFGAIGRSAIDGAGTGKAYLELNRPWKGTATLD